MPRQDSIGTAGQRERAIGTVGERVYAERRACGPADACTAATHRDNSRHGAACGGGRCALVARGRSAGGAADTNAAAARATVATSKAAEPAGVISALAVLPFVNTSGNAEDEYFSDGLADELAHGLSKLPGLRLAARTSSFAFKGKTIQAAEVDRALNVGAIIEGTVRRAGNRIRLTAQLTSRRDGQLMWSDHFERTGADVFAVQDAFTSAIVSALTCRLAGANPGGSNASAPLGVAARGTTDAVAYDPYLKERFYWAQRGAAPGDSAIKSLEATVQRDSMFARGWAGFALAYVISPNYNAAVDFDVSDAREEMAVRRALALDSTLADAYAARGFMLIRGLERESAAAALATARRLEPQNAFAAHWSGIQFHPVGDTAQSDRQMKIALTLDPLSPTTFDPRLTDRPDPRHLRPRATRRPAAAHRTRYVSPRRPAHARGCSVCASVPSGRPIGPRGDRVPAGNNVRTATEARRRAAGRPLRARQPSRGRRSRRTFAGYSTEPD